MCNEPSTARCVWWQLGQDSDLWRTDCHEEFFLASDTPEDNGMKFCCFCGKPLVGVPDVVADSEGE